MNEDDLDKEIENLEKELASIESTDKSGYSTPSPEKQDSTLVLFRELIKSPDSRKFGFLGDKELGQPQMAVRDILRVAKYCDVEGLNKLGDYFRTDAEITFSTSLSKKAKLLDNIVTQIKKEQKAAPPSPEKRTLFGFGKPTGGEQNG